MTTRFVFLASKSPRRSELLRQIGVAHESIVADAGRGMAEIDETPQPGEAPADYVVRLARAKAQAGWAYLSIERSPPHPVIAADTTVVVDGRILGKPGSDAEARAMLSTLSGRTHQVFTAVAVASAAGTAVALSMSSVTMREISDDEIGRYVALGESTDKAGAYAIQGHAAMFVEQIEGSYSGVMGLPLYETANLLTAAGLTLP